MNKMYALILLCFTWQCMGMEKKEKPAIDFVGKTIEFMLNTWAEKNGPDADINESVQLLTAYLQTMPECSLKKLAEKHCQNYIAAVRSLQEQVHASHETHPSE